MLSLQRLRSVLCRTGQGGQQITEMKTDDYTKRNKTAANGFTGSTDKDRPPNGGSDIP